MKWMICFLAGAWAGVAWAGAPEVAAPFFCTAELDRAVLPADQSGQALVQLKVKALPLQQRAPVNLCVVLDRSRSMRGEKLEQAKLAALRALQQLGPEDLFSMVCYASGVRTLIAAQQVHEGNRAELAARIEAIDTEPGTALFGGVSQGAAELRRHVEETFVHRMILLSDGNATAGPRSAREIGRLGAALAKEGMSISSIGLGAQFNEDLMRALAESSSGNSWFVESFDDMARVFDAELEDLLRVVALDVEVEVTFRPGVRPLRVIGGEGRIQGRQVRLRLNQVYAEAERNWLVEVEVAPHVASERVVLAEISGVFEDTAQSKLWSLGTTELSCGFSASAQAVEISCNPGVMRQAQLNRLADAMEQAVELSDQGRVQEAVQTVEGEVAEVNNWAAFNDDFALQQQAQRVQQQSAYLGRNELRKQWQMDNAMTRGNRRAVSQSYALDGELEAEAEAEAERQAKQQVEMPSLELPGSDAFDR